jgi:hypothetical protein
VQVRREQRVQPVPVLAEIDVDPVTISLQQAERLRVQAARRTLRSSVEAKHSHLAVVIHRGIVAIHLPHVPDHFGEPPLDDPQRIGHLKPAVLRRRIAQAAKGPRVCVGKHVGNAPQVAEDLVALFFCPSRQRPQHGQEESG